MCRNILITNDDGYDSNDTSCASYDEVNEMKS